MFPAELRYRPDTTGAAGALQSGRHEENCIPPSQSENLQPQRCPVQCGGGAAVSIRILLVDDCLTFVGAVRKFLDIVPGVDVVGQSHNGSDALEQAHALLPDLVLLDVIAPGLGGLEVARSLRLWPKSPAMVFLSMPEGTAYAELARELGALAYINKADFVVRLLPIIERMVAEDAAQRS